MYTDRYTHRVHITSTEQLRDVAIKASHMLSTAHLLTGVNYTTPIHRDDCIIDATVLFYSTEYILSGHLRIDYSDVTLEYTIGNDTQIDRYKECISAMWTEWTTYLHELGCIDIQIQE